MAQEIYTVEGRQFRTEADYNRALRDKEIIDKLRKRMDSCSVEQLKQLQAGIEDGKYRFLTSLGLDFADELQEKIDEMEKEAMDGGNAKASKNVKSSVKAKAAKAKTTKKAKEKKHFDKVVLDAYVNEELVKQEKRRKRTVVLCAVLAVLCLGYVSVYTYSDYKTQSSYQALSELKEKPVVQTQQTPEVTVNVTKNEEKPVPEVLEEYKNLLNKNKRLIGWVKIADTNIDYPVMQTSDNEYYLNHNLNQEYDKNGSIFMDKDCDVLKPSTNFILYGHHMKNGSMFGNLHLYGDEKYYQEHPYIQFDTIYEKGIYQVMYVFRSKVYNEEDIVFKYYQFIDALSEQEFDSYMQEMASLSYYDTGVTAGFGDQLLTLSTCDYQEKDGRFVVVAKKVAKE